MCGQTGYSEEVPGLEAYVPRHNPLQQVMPSNLSTAEQYSNMAWWYNQLNEYCDRRLTYEKERLPAIAGLAREFAHRMGYHYKAGIWVESFREGLLWNNEGHEIDTRTVPSWSWASITSKNHRTGTVYHNQLWTKGWRDIDKKKSRTSRDVELVDISVATKNDDAFG